MNSINSNTGALAALSVLKSIQTDMETRQSRVSTGLRVSSTKDDSATFVRAQTMRGDLLLQNTLGDSLDKWKSTTDVAISGAEQISDLMNELHEKSLLLVDAAGNPGPTKAIQADMEGLIAQIESVVESSEFSGVNLLKGRPATQTTTQTFYSLPRSTVNPSRLLSSLDSGHKAGAMPEDTLEAALSGTRRFVIPSSPLTPQSFTDLINPINSTLGANLRYISTDAAQSFTVDAGETAGRINLLMDTAATNFSGNYGTAAVEIWQNGVRVAASGQDYATDGAAVEAATAQEGPFLLSFDYDPENGEDIQIRVLGGSRGAGIEALQLQDPSQSVPEPVEVWNSQVIYETHAITEDEAGPLNPEEVSALRDDPLAERVLPIGVQANYTVDAGDVAAHVDLTFDAYDIADTMEIWQNGVRIAATGQSYAANGADVGEGIPVTGLNVLSFDYDPDLGPLTVTVNGQSYEPESAWAIGAVSMRELGVTPYTAANAGKGISVLYSDTYDSIPFDYLDNTTGGTTRIRSRDLSPLRLGLTNLDWDDPEAIVDRISSASKTVLSAVEYFGAHSRQISQIRASNLVRTDVMTEALGNLVDADLASEAAALETLRVREQLTTQGLAIANQAPSALLPLFRQS